MFVGNLPSRLDEEQLMGLFKLHNVVPSSIIIKKGHAIAQYSDVDVAQGAIDALQNVDFNGRVLQAKVARDTTKPRVCFTYQKNGVCERKECRYEHISGEQSAPQDKPLCNVFKVHGSCRRADRCKFSHESVAVGESSVESRQPFKVSPVCFAFQSGSCTRQHCRYPHVLLQETPRAKGMCFAYQEGACKRGEECRYIHAEPLENAQETVVVESTPEEQVTPATRQTSPAAQPETRACHSFKRSGTCRRGDACRFVHEAGPVGVPSSSIVVADGEVVPGVYSKSIGGGTVHVSGVSDEHYLSRILIYDLATP